MTHKILTAVLLCGSFACGAWWQGAGTPVQGQEEGKKTNTQIFMRAKLKSAQQALEGLATEDFKEIQNAAIHMQAMSNSNEWHAIQGIAYAQYSAEFRRCCEDLAKRAEQKNTDAAAMSYVQLTMACMNCHRYVRSTRIVQNYQSTPDILVADFSLPPAERSPAAD